MAPESERETCGKLMSAWNPGTGAAHCNRESGHDGSCSHTFTYQSEPTLTCSEVVERLATECCTHVFKLNNGYCDAIFDRSHAEIILHSWRERRVQELEECLRKLLGPHEWEKDLLAAKESAEKLLAKSEQIRKGAEA